MSAADFEIAAVVKSLTSVNEDFSVIHCGVGIFPPIETGDVLRNQCAGRDVLFIGTCGIFGDFSKPTLVTTDSVHWEPAGDRIGTSYPVPKMEPFTVSALPHLPVCRLICGPSVSVDAMKSLRRTTTIENIEFYSVLRTLSSCARSIRALFCITNAIGPDAHSQWKANFGQAGELSAEYVLANLRELGGRSAI
jgi:hypothetical protein